MGILSRIAVATFPTFSGAISARFAQARTAQTLLLRSNKLQQITFMTHFDTVLHPPSLVVKSQRSRIVSEVPREQDVSLSPIPPSIPRRSLHLVCTRYLPLPLSCLTFVVSFRACNIANKLYLGTKSPVSCAPIREGR